MLFYALSFLAGGLAFSLILYFKLKTQFTVERSNLLLELQGESTQLKAKLQSLESNQKTEVALQEKMSQHFEILANQIFETKSQKFTDQNYKNLATLLDPLKERIKDFEKKVEESYSHERAERGMLRGELGKLMELNQLMSNEARNLTLALKGENKTQGNWGELILENILERSGLRKNEEYTVQGSNLGLKNDEGKDIRPDVIVNLPDQKHIIIDSKMTLNAYEGYSSAETANDQERFAKLHLESIKKHVEGLSEKKYHSSDKLITPDFVILFMPLEPAFALAFKLKPDLFQWAWEKNIAIVSPTTLLTTLRTVAALWKQDRQEKNALEIAKRGGMLYDKFVGVITDLQGLGKRLDEAQRAHTDVVKKLSEGRGNIMDQIEELKTLGAKTEKNLPQLNP